ncbi:MAG: DUF5908 family protein [Pseudomonadales bacterium]|nr:DUF5908 family protein [Pseudomonadales bacterium]
MTIEVKQLVIKSSVSEGESNSQADEDINVDLEAFKKELLAECKQIVSESLANARER